MDSATRRRLYVWVAADRPVIVLTTLLTKRYPRSVTPLAMDVRPAELLACGATRVYVDGSPEPLTEQWDEPEPRFRYVEPLTEPPVSRRSLLGLSTELPVDPAAPDTTRLTQALDVLASRGVDVSALRPALPALTATGCIACGVCTKVCPEQALWVATTDTSVATLYHDRTRCRADGVCIDVCPYNALSRADSQDPAPVVALASGTLTTCAKCHTRFIGAGPLCPTCERQQRDPFGSWLPRP